MANVDWHVALSANDRWLRTVVLARVRHVHAVDEVMQEVALAAVRQSAPLQDPGKVAPWLYRLAVTQALLYRRKQGRREKLVDRYARRAARPAGTTQADPLEWLLAAERRQFVHQALGQLPLRDREILLLKYTQDWTYRQLAEHMGISAAAVESRLHRARQRLRAALTVWETFEEVSVR